MTKSMSAALIEQFKIETAQLIEQLRQVMINNGQPVESFDRTLTAETLLLAAYAHTGNVGSFRKMAGDAIALARNGNRMQ
jgi:hypothetical protein